MSEQALFQQEFMHNKHAREAVLGQVAAQEGAALVRAIETFFARFVVLPPGALLPLSLWTIGTYMYNAFDSFPYCDFQSPEKRCGNPRATEVMELLAANVIRTVGISEAALFRLVAKKKPTLVIDEAEMLSGKSERAEAIRALLNGGNRRDTKVFRCSGTNHEVKEFPIYCPKVLCSIRVCPDTIRDRSIVIPMQRRKPEERVERFISRRIRPEGEQMRTRIEAFIKERQGDITAVYEGLNVEYLEDRDSENWEPLIAILAVADPTRLDELKKAAEILTSAKAAADEDESLSLKLLADIRDTWSDGEPTALTVDLIERLKGLEDSPWANDVDLNPRKFAWFLKPFGNESMSVHTVERKAKGYRKDDLETAFARYLVPKGSPGSPAA